MIKKDNLLVTQKENIFIKIRKFLWRIFKKCNKKSEQNKKDIVNEQVNMSKKSFKGKIKIKNTEKEDILRVQREIEKQALDKERICELTNKLSKEQKDRLKELYIEQINCIKEELKVYKTKIKAIRKKI